MKQWNFKMLLHLTKEGYKIAFRDNTDLFPF